MPTPPSAPSTAEERANCLSHVVGLLGALVSLPFLIFRAARAGDASFIVGVAVFSASVLLLYLASALYHGLPPGRAKRVFQTLDHSLVFFLIAGTYSPITLGALQGPWGWSLFGVVWGLALIGILMKTFGKVNHPVLSTTLYVLMGWLIAVAAKPLMEKMPPVGLLLLLGGGLAYTGGVVFFAMESRWRYAHTIWHLFVIAGTALHYFAILVTAP
jgi:hemolysin III